MTSSSLRVVTALVGAPIVLFLAYYGGIPFVVLIAAGALGSQVEFYHLGALDVRSRSAVLGLALGMCATLRFLFPEPAVTLAVVLLVIVVAATAFRQSERAYLDLAATVAGAVYPALLLSFLAALRLTGPRGDGPSARLTILVILLVWAADTGAYYIGKTWGRRPLSAASPNKSWEGVMGGFAGGAVVAMMLKLSLCPFLSWADVVVLVLIVGTIGPLGDLAESRLKRSSGVKDSGGLLPGHGGLLDRLDALILVAPTAYLYLKWAGQI